jgi:DNA-binding NarL/FixJ family response regulator
MADVELVGERDRVADVLDAVESLRPDIVFLDVNLPDGSGLDVNRLLKDQHPEVRVIILTMVDDPQIVATAFRDGARAYLVKGAHPDLVENVLRTVMAGGVVMPPELLESVMGKGVIGAAPMPFGLTSAQLRVFTLLAKGLDNRAIARELHLSEKTVRNTVSTIFTKISAATRAEAVVIAHRHGIGAD